jgi:hypothetical protein
MNTRFKDGALLLVAGILCAAGAAVFWKYTGEWGVLIFVIPMLLVILGNKPSLRERLKSKKQKPDTDGF